MLHSVVETFENLYFLAVQLLPRNLPRVFLRGFRCISLDVIARRPEIFAPAYFSTKSPRGHSVFMPLTVTLMALYVFIVFSMFTT